MSGEPQLAIDTSFVIALLRGDVRSDRPLDEIAFPVPVVGELRFGAMSGRHPQQKLEEIEQLVGRGTILLSDGETSRVYAEVRHRLKAADTPLPENDV